MIKIWRLCTRISLESNQEDRAIKMSFSLIGIRSKRKKKGNIWNKFKKKSKDRKMLNLKGLSKPKKDYKKLIDEILQEIKKWKDGKHTDLIFRMKFQSKLQ